MLTVFQVLISGAQVPISLEDLKSFTNYSGMLQHIGHVSWDVSDGHSSKAVFNKIFFGEYWG
jgi:hypothetical protein